jgi:hypothetical protein
MFKHGNKGRTVLGEVVSWFFLQSSFLPTMWDQHLNPEEEEMKKKKISTSWACGCSAVWWITSTRTTTKVNITPVQVKRRWRRIWGLRTWPGSQFPGTVSGKGLVHQISRAHQSARSRQRAIRGLNEDKLKWCKLFKLDIWLWTLSKFHSFLKKKKRQ